MAGESKRRVKGQQGHTSAPDVKSRHMTTRRCVITCFFSIFYLNATKLMVKKKNIGPKTLIKSVVKLIITAHAFSKFKFYCMLHEL